MMNRKKFWVGLLCGVVGFSAACFEEAVEEGLEGNNDNNVAPTSFTVSSSDDVVWLGVYDRPTGSNAPDGEVGSGYVAYTLSGVGSGGVKKRSAPIEDRAWTWNQERFLLSERVLPSLRNESLSCAAGCNEGEYCIRQECSASHSLLFLEGEAERVEGRLQTVFDSSLAGIDVVLVVDTALSADEVASAEVAGQHFADELGKVASLINLQDAASVTDLNQDGRLVVVVTNQTAGSLGLDTIGWFNPHDWSGEADSNGADILWLRPGDAEALSKQVGTLIHEYFHLAAFSKRADAGLMEPEALWLDEALAHTLEDLSGWGSSNIGAAEEGLLSFSEAGLSSGDDSLAQRGIGYTFIRYLVDRHARAAGASSAADEEVVESVRWLYGQLMASSERGWNHDLLTNLDDPVMDGWLRAVLGSSAGYLSVGEADTSQAIGFDAFGQFPSADGFDVYLEGPQYEELASQDGAYEGFVAESGWNILKLTDLEPGTYTPELSIASGREGVLVVIPPGGL